MNKKAFLTGILSTLLNALIIFVGLAIFAIVMYEYDIIAAVSVLLALVGIYGVFQGSKGKNKIFFIGGMFLTLSGIILFFTLASG